MPPGILSSTLITVPVLDSLLASQAGQEHTYRLQLLSTKLAILTNRPSQPIKRSFDAELQILQCRLELAKVAVRLTNLRLAAGELGIVETDCKGMFKRIAREIRTRSDREARKSTGQERDVETASPQQGGGEGQGEGEGSYTGSDTGPTTGSDVMERRSIQTLTPAHPEATSTSIPNHDPSTTSPDPDNDPESESRTTSHSSLPSVSLSSSSADAKIAKYQNRQGVITNLRIEALRLLGEVEDLQGRPERRGRWDSLALKLEAG